MTNYLHYFDSLPLKEKLTIIEHIIAQEVCNYNEWELPSELRSKIQQLKDQRIHLILDEGPTIDKNVDFEIKIDEIVDALISTSTATKLFYNKKCERNNDYVEYIEPYIHELLSIIRTTYQDLIITLHEAIGHNLKEANITFMEKENGKK